MSMFFRRATDTSPTRTIQIIIIIGGSAGKVAVSDIAAQLSVNELFNGGETTMKKTKVKNTEFSQCNQQITNWIESL